MPDNVDAADAGPDYYTTCDGPECSEEVGRTEALTVAWANVEFCSRECRDRWTTRENRSFRGAF